MAVRFHKFHTIRVQLSEFQYRRIKEVKAMSNTKGETFSTIVADALSRTRNFK